MCNRKIIGLMLECIILVVSTCKLRGSIFLIHYSVSSLLDDGAVVFRHMSVRPVATASSADK